MRNRSKIIDKVGDEILNYEDFLRGSQLNKHNTHIAGWNDHAKGALRDLFDDIGLKPKQLEYYGPAESMQQSEAQFESPEDARYQNLLNGVFMELDMTDYQDTIWRSNEFYEQKKRKFLIHPA